MQSRIEARSDADFEDDEGISLSELGGFIAAQWRLILAGTVLGGALGFGGASLIPPTYTARTVIMPPQQQQGGAAAALSSLGALAGLAGGGGVKNTADQYIALMQSATVSDRLIDRYNLMTTYDAKFRVDARKDLAKNVSIAAGKKDGLISIDVDDRNPAVAANIANSYVDELRLMTNTLAVSEAQQRRKFFEQKLDETKAKLTEAQIALQSSGFSPGTLKVEPRTAAEGYARARAEVTAAEVKLQTLRRMLTDGAPEVSQQQALLGALRAELSKLEQKEPTKGDADYIGRYRDFKYQETLFDLYAKQFELARTDESREGALIQVVDVATPPEKKSKPKRGAIAVGVAVIFAFVLVIRAVVIGARGSRESLT